MHLLFCSQGGSPQEDEESCPMPTSRKWQEGHEEETHLTTGLCQSAPGTSHDQHSSRDAVLIWEPTEDLPGLPAQSSSLGSSHGCGSALKDASSAANITADKNPPSKERVDYTVPASIASFPSLDSEDEEVALQAAERQKGRNRDIRGNRRNSCTRIISHIYDRDEDGIEGGTSKRARSPSKSNEAGGRVRQLGAGSIRVPASSGTQSFSFDSCSESNADMRKSRRIQATANFRETSK